MEEPTIVPWAPDLIEAYARQGRDGDARRVLADLDTARPSAELRAAGARRHREPDSSLTPQERRVAAAVRRGVSTRDIVAELFLSPKTVEFHLRQIYRKLGVHSRTQLVAALAGQPETARA